LLSIVIWSIRRHRDPKLHIECRLPIDELIPSLARLILARIKHRCAQSKNFSAKVIDYEAGLFRLSQEG
jgi:hypothetical protein